MKDKLKLVKVEDSGRNETIYSLHIPTTRLLNVDMDSVDMALMTKANSQDAKISDNLRFLLKLVEHMEEESNG